MGSKAYQCLFILVAVFFGQCQSFAVTAHKAPPRGDDTMEIEMPLEVPPKTLATGEQSFLSQFHDHKGRVVLMFTDPSDQACKEMSQLIEKFKGEYPDTLFVEIDASKHPNVSSFMGVTKLPSLFLYKSGADLKRLKSYKKELEGGSGEETFKLFLTKDGE